MKKIFRKLKSLFVPVGKAVAGPADPFAFIRVRNEIKTIGASLASILPAIKRGVVAYNDCDDGSEEIILDFCKKNPGFIPAKYETFQNFDDNIAEKLARYYNFALSIIPKNEWIVKIDVDQIYDAEKLKKIFRMPKRTTDVIILPRIELHWQDGELYVLKNKPFGFGRDAWLIYNDDDIMFIPAAHGQFERLRRLNRRRRIMGEITNWHFPKVKNSRGGGVGPGDLAPFGEWMKNWDGKIIENGRLYDKKYLDPKMLDRDHIMSYVKQFRSC